MDWKLDQKRREKNQAMANKEAAQNVNIVSEMEREFEQIFGGINAGFFRSRGQAGDPVRRNETSSQCKVHKGD